MKLETPIPTIRSDLQIAPWQYLHELQTDSRKRIAVGSPVRWVLSYPSRYNLQRLLQDHLQGTQPAPDEMKELLVHSLVLSMLFEKFPGLTALLEELRFPVAEEHLPISGQLPYLVATAPIPSFRLTDEEISRAIAFVGGNYFEELIDLEAIQTIAEPLKQRFSRLIQRQWS
jgi:hypothetical protein